MCDKNAVTGHFSFSFFLFFATMGPLCTHTYTQKHTHCAFWFCVLMGFLYVWTNMCLCLCIYLCFSFFFFDSSVLSYSELLFSSILFYYFYSLDYCFLRRDRMVVDPVWGEVEQELGRVGGRKTAIWIYCKKKKSIFYKEKNTSSPPKMHVLILVCLSHGGAMLLVSPGLAKDRVERMQEPEVVENFRETVFSRHERAVACKNSQQ